VGVENGFYNNPDQTSADNAITHEEPHLADLIRKLRAYPATTTVGDPRIPELLVHLSARTSALRAWTSDTFLKLIDTATRELLNPATLQHIFQNESVVRAAVVANATHMNLPPNILATLPALLTAGLPHLATDWSNDVQHVVRQLVDQTLQEIPLQLRNGHNTALAGPRKGTRNHAYEGLMWHVCLTTTPLLLGDSALIVEIDGPQPFKALNDGPDRLRAVYLPLSSTHVLVGTPGHESPQLNVPRLNDAIVRCSYDFFISKDPIPDPSLHARIGEWAGLLSQAEVAALITTITSHWPFDPSAPIPARFTQQT
jgi:hypothetical protein